mmetsp:Transcript_8136/g.23352  ORF Transcript_8136/g.23352 Transcript_8136/m.23352 type:complete len:94 (+) Transcript_8136:473-754(+)
MCNGTESKLIQGLSYDLWNFPQPVFSLVVKAALSKIGGNGTGTSSGSLLPSLGPKIAEPQSTVAAVLCRSLDETVPSESVSDVRFLRSFQSWA